MVVAGVSMVYNRRVDQINSSSSSSSSSFSSSCDQYVNTISDVFRPRDRHLINFDFYAGAVTIVAYNTRFCEIVNCKLHVCSWMCGITY